MRIKFTTESFAIGLAMFSMFFGAGNVIFPLAVGQFAGDRNLAAMFGLITTAAIMPIAGVIAMVLFDGDYKRFFGRLGNAPGFILALVTISLLGPLGSTPRCIALSYTTLRSSFLEMSPYLFNALSCLVIFLFTIRRSHILTLLGWVLTPLLLASLILIIILGIIAAPTAPIVEHSSFNMFLHGLKEGYNTMDLLAAFFFSSTILSLLKIRAEKLEDHSNHYINTALQASVVGTVLLAAIYVGFSYLASFHGQDFPSLGKDELLAAITMKIAGPYGGILVCVTIALACLTTAIALITAFTDYFQKEVLQEKVSYEITLIASLLVTFVIASFNFDGISAFLGPILQICYPGLIVLTFLNIAYQLAGVKMLKTPVFVTFAISAVLYFST